MRYFLEVSYKGTNYSGFQSQKNANTIQDEIEKAFFIFLKKKIQLTGSSRTDSGVHALQNYFHFDCDTAINSRILYNLNSILPYDIVLKNLIQVKNEANCRFDAISREYKYTIYQSKNPFLKEVGYYFPYHIDLEELAKASLVIKEYSDFTSFSKKHTQVKSFECKIYESEWRFDKGLLVYYIKGNRFLRGMVRAITATMLKIGIGKLSVEDFRTIIESKDCANASFAAPAKGLQLINVQFPDQYFEN